MDEAAAHELCRSLPTEVLFFPLDVADGQALVQAMQVLLDRWGDIDVLINNVGVGGFTPLTACSVEHFDRILATNLRPVFITSQALAVHRNHEAGRASYGRIINISSTRYLQSEPGTEAYAASKGGVVSLTHALALSFSNYRVTVNCISPGWIANEGYDALSPTDHAQHPSGRVGRPDDIARACLFLAAPDNDFINGQNIVVDGGMTKKMIYAE